MAFPDLAAVIDLMGYRGIDKITGFKGVITCVSFDLYGCTQVVLNPGLGVDDKMLESGWFDINRITVLRDNRVMIPPPIGAGAPADYDQGPAEKPARSF